MSPLPGRVVSLFNHPPAEPACPRHAEVPPHRKMDWVCDRPKIDALRKEFPELHQEYKGPSGAPLPRFSKETYLPE